MNGRIPDIVANRASPNWTTRENIGRVLWAAFQPLFRNIPRPLWSLRSAILRLFGAEVGRNVNIHPTVIITIPWNVSIGNFSAIGDRAELYALGPIKIGEAVTISQKAHLCAGTHDYKRADMALVKATVSVEDGAWVCADAFVGPSVSVGTMAIIGARAVVMRDVAPFAIVAGNPATTIGRRPPLVNQKASLDPIA
jgi:putative colanic acid biosynthesis acetyltransferase WcaF